MTKNLYLKTTAFVLSALFTTATAQTISFTTPDTVCVTNPMAISNASTGSNYYWNFCSDPLNVNPITHNLGNFGAQLSTPVYSTVVTDNGNYYVFVVNHNSGTLLRLDYGNSLLNTPTANSLGNLTVLPNQCEAIQIRKDGNNWIGIVIGGQSSSSISRINFGTSITNTTPTAVNMGNIGGLAFPIDMFMFQESGNWYAYVTNLGSSTITKLSFGITLANTPTGTNLGNIGALSQPNSMQFIKDATGWHAYVANYYSGTITLLEFGTSLLNTPTGSNLGNLGNLLSKPRELMMVQSCGKKIAYVINEDSNKIVKLVSTAAGFAGPFTVTSLGTMGGISQPTSMSDFFRVGDSLYSIITNFSGNTLSRMAIASCVNPALGSFTAATPSPVTFPAAGIYNFSLFMDEGLPTQSSQCKQIVVLSAPAPTVTQTGNTLSTGVFPNYQWYSNGAIIPGATSQSYTPAASGTYYVIVSGGGCSGQSAAVIYTPSGIANVPGGAGIQVYPNPASNQLFIKSPVKVNATLYSVDGKKVMEQKNAGTLQLSNLSQGYYLLNLTDENGQLILIEKVIKSE